MMQFNSSGQDVDIAKNENYEKISQTCTDNHDISQ